MTTMLLPTHSNQTARIHTLPSSEAKNGFAGLIESVARSGKPVLITRNKRPAAVMLSVEEYQRLLGATADPLEPLRDRFAAIVASMQSDSAKHAVDTLFGATPVQLGRAAVKTAGKTRR